jgi:predicted AAA+ superfamily ATPase
MGRFAQILDRLERVLGLAEQHLIERSAPTYAPDFFEDHLAFRWEAAARGDAAGRLVPIEAPLLCEPGDLIGIARNLDRLARNTRQHVRGLPSNHVLLFGERGTGKSSAVKSLLSTFGSDGLRLIEVHRDELIQLPLVLRAIARDAGHHRFLIFADDLSFGPGEPGYRELKAALEGSLDGPPENVRIVATSNRRHLLPESMLDNRGAHVDEQGELHIGEALDEKLALADRFGLELGFYPFDQETYLAIVRHYYDQAGLPAGEWDAARAGALRWALERASRSGRTAYHFVVDLAGRAALDAN